MNYKNYNYGSELTSADSDTVETAIVNGDVTPEAPEVADLYRAAEWLALYACGDDLEIAQSFANVVAFLQLTGEAKIQRKAINNAKRAYAQEKGIKFSQVRVAKKAI
jgi:hypothetical protein